jgi:hypothetical protein
VKKLRLKNILLFPSESEGIKLPKVNTLILMESAWHFAFIFCRYLKSEYEGIYLLQVLSIRCPIHVVTFTLISILATDYIQKRRGQAPQWSITVHKRA